MPLFRDQKSSSQEGLTPQTTRPSWQLPVEESGKGSFCNSTTRWLHIPNVLQIVPLNSDFWWWSKMCSTKCAHMRRVCKVKSKDLVKLYKIQTLAHVICDYHKCSSSWEVGWWCYYKESLQYIYIYIFTYRPCQDSQTSLGFVRLLNTNTKLILTMWRTKFKLFRMCVRV